MAKRPEVKAEGYSTTQLKKRYLIERGKGLSVSGSAEAAGIARKTIYLWRSADPAFVADEQAAYEAGIDALEDEARRRAYEGVDKPVYQKGERVGLIREYSDTLLIFLLKGGRPDKFRERQDVNHSGTVGMSITIDDLRAADAGN